MQKVVGSHSRKEIKLTGRIVVASKTAWKTGGALIHHLSTGGKKKGTTKEEIQIDKDID